MLRKSLGRVPLTGGVQASILDTDEPVNMIFWRRGDGDSDNLDDENKRPNDGLL